MNTTKIAVLTLLVILGLSIVSTELRSADFHTLKIGDVMPDFSLPGIDGKTHTPADYRDSQLLMIAFLANHCPDSQAAEGRIKKFVEQMKGKSFVLVAINPNHPDAVGIEEMGYAKYGDSFEDMKKHAAEQQFNFPYLYDGETQATANAFGCLATPHVFLFDQDRQLRYQGAFDDSRFADPATVTSTDAHNAVVALLAGKPVPVEVTKPHGCSTKWISKKQQVVDRNEKWAHEPVSVEMIDVAGVAALCKNGTPKLRLINVWATTCVPCVIEFPELVKISRQFGNRSFELITISADNPDDADRVKTFLEKRGVAMPARVKRSVSDEGRQTNNYIFSGANMTKLFDVLDPESPAVLPHTVLLSPEGKILWRHNGMVDGDQLRDAILESLGRFYQPE